MMKLSIALCAGALSFASMIPAASACPYHDGASKTVEKQSDADKSTTTAKTDKPAAKQDEKVVAPKQDAKTTTAKTATTAKQPEKVSQK